MNVKIADAQAVAANGIAYMTWVANINEVLQLSLTVFGIVSAIFAIRYHLRKTREIEDREIK